MDASNLRGLRTLLIVTCLTIIIAAMKAAAPILVTLLLSIFITIICEPPVVWMRSKGVPNIFAILAILLAIIVVWVLLVIYVGASVNDFTKSLPDYENKWSVLLKQLSTWAAQFGIEFKADQIKTYLDPGMAMNFVSKTFASLSDALANAFVILLIVIFMLMEATSLPMKITAAFGQDAKKALGKMSEVAHGVNRYLAIKTVVSLVTGAVIAVWLAILGLDYPLLWGLLAFMLNYVPNIGSIIAAVPAVLLALIQLDLSSTLLVAAGYMTTNIVMGNVVEPRIMGRGVGLSTLVVFLSLIIWGWVLGPIGMLLSVPLSMVIKIVLDSNDQTRWLAILLGSESEAKQYHQSE